MSIRNFTSFTDNTLLFSGISVNETGVGTTNSFISDDVMVLGSIDLPTGIVAGLSWRNFVAGASGPGSSLSLEINYTITETDPVRGITGIRSNSFVPDTTIPVGSSLSLRQEVRDASGTLIGSSQLTRAPTVNDAQDPPFEAGDLNLLAAYGTVSVKIVITVSIATTAAAGTGVSFSAMTQNYNDATSFAGLGDYVFEDKNRNGVQDAGDLAIAGVTVQLLDAAGAQIGTTTTNGVGFYEFLGLTPGAYSVRFVTPTGFAPTLANQGANDALDSDAVAGGITQQVTLASGDFNGTLDAGFFKPTRSLDLEKTTSGPSNSNPVAANYDNEDLPNGAGVPILVAGTSVTWTYQVRNTGEAAFAASELVLVDDNGTVANMADDMSIANGTITFQGVQTGDGDNLLEAGEVWLYRAAGTVQNLGTMGAATTFNLAGSSALDGTDGNERAFTSGGISAKATAFSRDSTGTWQTGYLGAFGGGLGVTDRAEGDGSGNKHTVDNTDRDNYVLFRFNQSVVLDKAFLGYVVDDSDLRIWIGNVTGAFGSALTLSDAVLANLGFTEVNETTLTTARWADLNASNIAGNVVVIAANTGEATTEDNFKIDQLVLSASGSGIYANKATISAPNATGDSDLSHYRNGSPAAPGLDLEKTTNGSTNSNHTAPDYNNEDTANGVGVPVLAIGSDVTWTYRLANTGNTAFAASEIVLVDDNGTIGNTTDDMSIANGKITFQGVQTGDADNLLEAGEVWLYKATGTVKNLTTPGITTNFDFSGSSALDGTDGNERSFTSGGVSVKATAWSRVDGANGAWANGFLGAYGSGLGVTDRGEGNGSGDRHTVDNMEGRDNYVLFRFDQSVIVDKAYLGYVVGDSDISVWIGNVNNAFNTAITLSDAMLTGLGFKEINDTTLTSARWADFNAGNLAGNVLVIAASDIDTTPEDRFKIDQLTVQTPSQSGVYSNKATVSAQGVSDFDLSHYKNGAAPKPGIDIEKTTNGPTNSNHTAPTYDNEDVANGTGVPILTPGSDVSWTYQVKNTGGTQIAAADIKIVDDNGTIPNTADDMSIANGKIMRISREGTNEFLDPGETWTYQASAKVQNLVTWSSATTLDFSGSSALDGTDGNIRTYTSGDLSVKAGAWSRVDGAGGAWANGFLGTYGSGLGVTDRGEGNGSGDRHTVDNMGGRDNYILFRFNQDVVVDKAYLGYVVGDSDISIWIGDISDAFNANVTLSDSVLAGLGFKEVNDTTSTAARWADFNAGNLSGNVLVIAASDMDMTPDDRFKLDQLVVRKEPDVGTYANKATVWVPGASDFDLSHYTNNDIWH